MSLLARFTWATSWVMVSLGDDGIDTHGGVTHPLGVGGEDLCLIDDLTGQIEDERRGLRALDAVGSVGEHRGMKPLGHRDQVQGRASKRRL